MEKTENGGLMVTKFFMILEYLSKRNQPVRIQDISTHLDIPQATMSRYLASMVREGYVFQDEESQRYKLTWKVCKIASKVCSPIAAKEIVSPYVYKLSSKYNIGSAAMMIMGYDGVYIELLDSASSYLDSIMRMSICPPLNSTASGKVLLSQFTSTEIDDFIATKGLEKVTAATIIDRNKFDEEIESIRNHKYAIEINECSMGVECIAVPVYDFNDRIYMALSVFDRSHITDAEHLNNVFLPELVSCAKEISTRLGCSNKKLLSYQ